MNVEDLQSARNRERRTDSLQSLPDSFYSDADAFVTELRAERDAVAAEVDDPFDSEEINRLTNSINTAENTIEAIYERRVGKVVKLASLDAAGMSVDDDGLTAEERDLFASLTDAIEHNRQGVLGTGDRPEDSDGTADDPSETDASTTPAESTVASAEPAAESPSNRSPSERPAEEVGAADVMGSPAGTATAERSGKDETDPSATDAEPSGTDADNEVDRNPDADSPEEAEAIERTTIRITRDVGQIMGVDERTYRLASEEVVRLPAANAKPLLDRNAAERIE